jgi:hypothetical protein
MQVGEASTDPFEKVYGDSKRRMANLLQIGFQGLPLNSIHDVVGSSLVNPGGVNPYQVGVMELPGLLDLALKASQMSLIPGSLGEEHLHRPALSLRPLPPIDHSHAAGTQNTGNVHASDLLSDQGLDTDLQGLSSIQIPGARKKS